MAEISDAPVRSLGCLWVIIWQPVYFLPLVVAALIAGPLSPVAAAIPPAYRLPLFALVAAIASVAAGYIGMRLALRFDHSASLLRTLVLVGAVYVVGGVLQAIVRGPRMDARSWLLGVAAAIVSWLAVTAGTALALRFPRRPARPAEQALQPDAPRG